MSMIQEEDLKDLLSYSKAVEYITDHHEENISKTGNIDSLFLNNFHQGIMAGYAASKFKKTETRVATILGVCPEMKYIVQALVESAHVEVIKVYNPVPLDGLNFCLDTQYLIPATLIIPVNEVKVALGESDFVLIGSNMSEFDLDMIPKGALVISCVNDSIELEESNLYRGIDENFIRENDEMTIFYQLVDDDPYTNNTENYLANLLI